MNDPASHQPTSPAPFAAGALCATGGALCACFGWLMAFIFSFAGVLFVGQPWTFAVTAGLMLLPGLLALFDVAPLRWFAIGFTLPTLALLAVVLLVVATSGVPHLLPDFS